MSGAPASSYEWYGIMGSSEANNGAVDADMHTLAPAKTPNGGSLLHHLSATDAADAEYPLAVPPAPAATPVKVTDESTEAIVKTEPLDPEDYERCMAAAAAAAPSRRDHFSLLRLESHPSMMITSELLRLIPGENDSNDEDMHYGDESNDTTYRDSILSDAGYSRMSHHNGGLNANGPKTWSQLDMENALEALRTHNMSLTKASSTFGIPSTTLWQRAHRLGIDTPKKEGPSKSWNETNLHNALQALRTGTISANKASKAYGIPSSTLYKIARREGIKLAAPFNAAPTSWRPGDLERALQSIRSGHSSVQRASTEFGIPTGTLYGRCKREGIELSRSNPTPWSEGAMGEALEAVRVGQMSINQAAIHFNLPYSSLYGRFKRCKYDVDTSNTTETSQQVLPLHVSNSDVHSNNMLRESSGQHQMFPEYRQINPNTRSATHPITDTVNTNCNNHNRVSIS